jgi:hypothetical protein
MPVTPRCVVLAWRPDGKQLAVGLEDGKLLLLNTENGEMQHSQRLFDGPVAALAWTEIAVGASAASAAGQGSSGRVPSATTGGVATRPACPDIASEDRLRRHFAPPPPPLSAQVNTGPKVGYAMLNKPPTTSWPSQPERLAVLGCVSRAGELLLLTLGMLRLAAINLPAVLRQYQMTIRQVCVQHGVGGA